MNGADLITEIDRWRQQGRELRKQLISEREILAAKVAEIDKRLASLPSDPDDLPSPRAQLPQASNLLNTIVPEQMSVADMVSHVIRNSTRNFTAGEIIEMVNEIRPGVKPEMVHSAIYRLKEREVIEAHGNTGSRTFSWKGG